MVLKLGQFLIKSHNILLGDAASSRSNAYKEAEDKGRIVQLERSHMVQRDWYLVVAEYLSQYTVLDEHNLLHELAVSRHLLAEPVAYTADLLEDLVRLELL